MSEGDPKMKQEGRKTRKTRSDKKVAIAPFISDQHRVWIHRIARHVEWPEGEVGIRLIELALYNEECIRFFGPYFKRSFWFSDDLCFPGNQDPLNIEDYIRIEDDRGRFKVKAKQDLYQRLDEFKIALGTSYLSHATYALLKYALYDLRLIQMIAPRIDFVIIRDTVKQKVNLFSRSAWSILN
jgi:hypothetical protein